VFPCLKFYLIIKKPRNWGFFYASIIKNIYKNMKNKEKIKLSNLPLPDIQRRGGDPPGPSADDDQDGNGNPGGH